MISMINIFLTNLYRTKEKLFSSHCGHTVVLIIIIIIIICFSNSLLQEIFWYSRSRHAEGKEAVRKGLPQCPSRHFWSIPIIDEGIQGTLQYMGCGLVIYWNVASVPDFTVSILIMMTMGSI